MKIKKLRDVKTPERGTQWSAGIDFFVPNDFTQVTLKPNQDVSIASGIKCQIPHGYALLAVNKSGIALHKRLQIGACLVDEDYTGELHLHVYNCGREEVTINPGDKLVQFVLTPVFYDSIELIEDEIKLPQTTKKQRGDGGFGSTNKKEESQIEILESIMQEEPEKQLPKLERVTAHIIKIDPARESKHGGSYRRHYFRDAHNQNITYVLDVTWSSKNIFKFLNLDDTLTNLIVFQQNGKNYINGKSSALKIGKWTEIKELVNPTKKIKGIELL